MAQIKEMFRVDISNGRKTENVSAARQLYVYGVDVALVDSAKYPGCE